MIFQDEWTNMDVDNIFFTLKNYKNTIKKLASLYFVF